LIVFFFLNESRLFGQMQMRAKQRAEAITHDKRIAAESGGDSKSETKG